MAGRTTERARAAAEPLGSLDELARALRCLPGVGPKAAQRMALHLLQYDRSGAVKLARALEHATGAVRQVRVRWLARALRVTLYPHTKATSLRLEVWGGARKADLLERIAGRTVELVAPDGTVYDNEQGVGNSR